VDRNDLHVLSVVCPPNSEQKSIASFLDRETAHIDTLIAKKERLIELLTEKRSAFISHAVTKGLDPTVPMKDSGLEWLGEIPAHWIPKKLKYLFRQTKRQNYADLTVLSVYRNYGVIEKESRDDNHNRTPENLDTYQLVNVGDLVINKMKAWQGSLGMSEHQGITSPDYVVYAPEHDEDSRFLHYLLRAEAMADVYRSISNGIRPSQWRLEPENFEKLVIFLPPRSEQAQICQFIDLEYKRIEHLITQIQKLISYLSEYRTTLISAAVTGKIDVREEVG
jgi:type I restriction enzyme S subunit